VRWSGERLRWRVPGAAPLAGRSQDRSTNAGLRIGVLRRLRPTRSHHRPARRSPPASVVHSQSARVVERMSAGGSSTLKSIALFSFFYDVSVGVAMSLGRGLLVDWFGVAPPQPPIHADLNAVFVTTVGIGYLLPFRDPVRYRGYLWLMGPLLKGVGAVVFVLDYLYRGSPPSF